MSNPKLLRIAQEISRQIRQAAKTFTKGFVTWLLRGLLVLGRQPLGRSGFVLPTTVLLLLVLTLTVGSIGFRTYTRTQQTIGERQQRVIFNAATPAIDRARAKLEFLFDANRDPRLPSGIPSETQILGMLYNDNRLLPPTNLSRVPRYAPNNTDPYTFTGETRVNIGDDGLPDNAWRYRTDTDGDGQADATVIYSILLRTPLITGGVNPLAQADQQSVRNRATALMVRHGPLSNTIQQNSSCVTTTSANPQEGWFPDPIKTTILRKNFQVNAYVLPDAANGTVSTLEFHQDRYVTLGNRWGAWFRNDLEIFPGPAFNWNGAMHTEGNLITGNNNFTAYMISSPRSCLYTKDASIVTVTEIAANADTGAQAFQGQFISGKVGDNPGFSDENRFHLFTEANVAPISDANDNRVRFNPTSDSVVNSPGSPVDYALDPVVLQTKDQSVSRGATPANPRPATWDPGEFRKRERMYNEFQEKPFVDDFFRADNRYGPKPTYGNVPVPNVIGEDIPASQTTLVRNEPLTPDDPTDLGQDGYWERRARYEGMRVIMGQRLELGDPAGWGGPINSTSLTREPLKPWRNCPSNSTNPNRCNEARQRTALWDNLAAVQGTVVYHAAANPNNLDYPAVCIATTVHPGTAATLEDSSTFENLTYSSIIPAQANAPKPFQGPSGDPTYSIKDGPDDLSWTSDFFRGRGTNGWEYALPNESNFRNLSSPLMVALKNLANFAGDPNGGAPSFTPVTQDNVVHPYPSMAQWGDFSMLRRVINLMENGTAYDRLSPADKTVLHSAGCTIGMLAHNVDFLERFDVERFLDSSINLNAAAFRNLVGYKLSEIPATVTSAQRTSMQRIGLRGYLRRMNNPGTYGRHYVTSVNGSTSQVPDLAAMVSDRNQANNPEAIVRLLERWRDRIPNNNAAQSVIDSFATNAPNARDELNQLITLAQLIITKEQVARDRKYGFFGSGVTSGNTVYGAAPLGRCTQWNPLPIRLDEEPLGLLCSARPRYPILFSLFPALDNQAPFAYGADINAPAAYDPAQINYSAFEAHGETPEVARDSDDSSDNYILTANSGSQTYKVVRPGDIALRPKVQSSWVMPSESASSGFVTPSNNRDTLIKVCAQLCTTASTGEPVPSVNPPRYSAYPAASMVRIPFKDTAPFNGREMMVTRMLDLNLDFLRNSPIGTDRWLPNSGIIYSFREDAVSEPEINRPARTRWSSCNTATTIVSTNCRMLTDNTVDAFISRDPPLNSDNLISPKPVDFYADPDRRPFGFRLRNGKTINRPDDVGRGLSMISDNPVYIQGDFNCHIANAADDCQNGRIEEFTQLLPPNFTPADFYGRTTPDIRFAKIATDLWRPSEILADAVSIVSNNFCDGSIDDGFQNIGRGATASIPFRDSASSADYGCQGNGADTSYLNQNLPTPALVVPGTPFIWARSNPADTLGFDFSVTNTPDAAQRRAASRSPVMINRQGNPMVMASQNSFGDYGSAGQTYETFGSDKSLIDATQTRVNAIIISGLVPSRQFQSYGGLHNFPRFLERWGGNQLFIAGAFLQLNFSTHGTAPFDQDAWAPGTNPANGESIRYYGPPPRRWGYDVGLQYAPAGPVARRFASPPQASRSEFYSEPAANDPYIVLLCRQVSANCSPPA